MTVTFSVISNTTESFGITYSSSILDDKKEPYREKSIGLNSFDYKPSKLKPLWTWMYDFNPKITYPLIRGEVEPWKWPFNYLNFGH